MKDRKRRLEIFSFYDHTGMARHLQRMAAKGWMLEKIGGFGWVYRKTEPKTVHFTVSYFPNASEFDPETPESQREFQEFCRHTGWNLAASSGQLQIFCNEQKHPIPIETDPVLEVETLHKTAKKSFLMPYFLLLAISVLDLTLGASSLLDRPVELLASVVQLFSLFAWGVLLVLCASELASYFFWLHRARKAAAEGIFLESRGTSGLQKWIFSILALGFGYWLLHLMTNSTRTMVLIAAVMIGMNLVIFGVVFAVRTFLKRKKVSARWNMALTMGLSFVISFGLILFGTAALIHANGAGVFDWDQETYEYRGSTFPIYRDQLPLTVEDLVALSLEDDPYIRQKTGSESPLLARYTMDQRPRLDAENYRDFPDLHYTVTQVKVPFLYEFCRTQLLSVHQDQIYDGGMITDRYEMTDPAPWGAKEAYQVYRDDGYRNQYLLCYDRTLVELNLDWAPTEAQMAIVGEKLGH